MSGPEVEIIVTADFPGLTKGLKYTLDPIAANSVFAKGAGRLASDPEPKPKKADKKEPKPKKAEK